MALRPLRTRPVISFGGEVIYPEDHDTPMFEPKECCEADECPDCGRFLPDCECADENLQPDTFAPDD